MSRINIFNEWSGTLSREGDELTRGPRFFGAILAVGFSTLSLAYGRTISQDTARKLVHDALVTLNKSGPSVKIARFRYDYAPEFYAFAATWPNPDGDPLIGYFAVNPWTGDVWDIMGCKRITSPAIEKEQDAIWKRSQIAPEAKGTLQEKSPACSAIELKMSGRGK